VPVDIKFGLYLYFHINGLYGFHTATGTGVKAQQGPPKYIASGSNVSIVSL
jgi:hypothetical protein